jgi:riboflavin transporter FmnP
MPAFRKFLRGLTLGFGAGAFGALIMGLSFYLATRYGFMDKIHVRMAAHLTLDWFVPRVFYGALWGCLFGLPLLTKTPFFRTVVLSVVPALVELFVLMPLVQHSGTLGLSYGQWTPVFIWSLYLIWSIMTTAWLALVGGNK